MGSLKKRCKTYGCPNLHHNASGYCDECTAKYRESHPRQESEKPTASARKAYGSWKWRKFASDFLRLHPVCEICGAPARVCDHKDMTADMMVDAYGGFDYEPSHYQALCYSCNARKGMRLVLKSEINIRVHFCIAMIVLALAFVLDFSIEKMCILLLTIAFVIVTEMLNSAIEFSLDAVFHNRYSKLVGMAKDISAGAVMFASVVAIVIGVLLFGSALLKILA